MQEATLISLKIKKKKKTGKKIGTISNFTNLRVSHKVKKGNCKSGKILENFQHYKERNKLGKIQNWILNGNTKGMQRSGWEVEFQSTLNIWTRLCSTDLKYRFRPDYGDVLTFRMGCPHGTCEESKNPAPSYFPALQVERLIL